MGQLMCHNRVELNDLKSMNTPLATETHVPVPHFTAVSEILGQLDNMGYEYSNLEIGVSHQQERCYWMMDLSSDHVARDWGTSIGGRNSHDKMYPYSLYAGINTFICSNLLATGEVSVKTKHTKHIMDRLPRMVTRALYKLTQHNINNNDRVEKYKEYELPEEEWHHLDESTDGGVKYTSSEFIHDFVIKSMDRGVISSSAVKTVLDEWRVPRFPEFAVRTAWSLSNAYTESFKKYSNPVQLYDRGIKLTAMIDDLVGYVAPELEEMPEDEEIVVN